MGGVTHLKMKYSLKIKRLKGKAVILFSPQGS